MRHSTRVFLEAFATLVAIGILSRSSTTAAQFDGPWDVNLVCTDIPGGSRGYDWQFHAEFKDRVSRPSMGSVTSRPRCQSTERSETAATRVSWSTD